MSETETVETRLYLTFKIENELLALYVSQVREVLDLCAITRVPRTPEYMKGVINLRGSVIPVLDLRLKFGMSETESTVETRIIIIEFELDGVMTELGILTESVHDVIGISDDNIKPPPESGARWRTENIRGIGKHGETFILLLDIQRIFTGQGMTAEAG